MPVFLKVCTSFTAYYCVLDFEACFNLAHNINLNRSEICNCLHAASVV